MRWIEDSLRRTETGWWLDPANDEPAQRLRIDPAIGRLAADCDSPAQLWHERADATRSLTVATALMVAESRLDPCKAVAPERHGLPRRRYEIYVDGAGVETLGLAFPDLATEESGMIVLLSGRLDEAGLVRTLRRLRGLGCRVAGYVAVGDHR